MMLRKQKKWIWHQLKANLLIISTLLCSGSVRIVAGYNKASNRVGRY